MQVYQILQSEVLVRTKGGNLGWRIYPLLLSLLNGGDLLGDHRQHFDVNAVKLVKTRPGSGTEISS